MFDVPGTLASAWGSYAYEDDAWEPASSSKNYLNIFSRGYFLSSPGGSLPTPPAWRREVLGDRVLAYDPDVPVVVRHNETGDASVVVIGYCFDPAAGYEDAHQSADGLLQALESERGLAAVDDVALWLGGRFVIFVHTPDELRVHVDAMASRACFWGDTAEGIVLSSHSELIARATGNPASERRAWILQHPEYDSKFGVSLPGLTTAHDAARHVYANCVLRVRGRSVDHERVFPNVELRPLTVEDATEEFVRELRAQISMWFRVSGKAAIALTSGMDSRALLAAGLDQYQSHRATALTYHFFERDAPTTRADLLGANALALRAGLRHRILNIEQIKSGTPMQKLYTTTFTSFARFPGLARVFYENLSATETLTIGIGGGIGTVHHTNRDDPKITPEVLARRYTPSAIHKNPKLHAVMREYIEYTQFSHERISNFDFYDLFHWEHRLTNWGSLGYAEYDLGPIVALPFNSRRVLVPMLSLPLQERRDKAIYRRIMELSGFGDPK